MRPNPIEHRPRQERGIALVAAVLVVLLSTLLLAAFMTTTTGERAMSSNVQTAKMSLYAADAGVRTEQQRLANFAKAKMDSCVLAWNNAGANTDSLIIRNPKTIFPGPGYSRYSFASTNPTFSSVATIAFSDTDKTRQMQTYYYRYTIQSQGSAGTAGTRRVQSQGILQLSAARGQFTDYLMFMNVHQTGSGGAIWFTSATTFDGRTHTNGKFHFAFKPTFQDLVTSVDANADYNNNGATRTLNANNNGTIDVPNFFGGFQRNQPNVPLPTNAWSQQMSALSNAAAASAPTNNTINTLLGLGSSGSTPANGIYVPNSGGLSTGGIYVQGDLNQMKMWADADTTKKIQWYQLTQGATVKTIKIDRDNNQTKVWNGTNTAVAPVTSLSNVPLSGVVYVEGGINDLRGPDRSSGDVLPAISEGTQALITAQKDIVITRDITDDSYAKQTNVLGIMTVNGGVRVGNSSTGAPADINIDAFIMATATNSNSYNGWTSSMPGQFCVDDYDRGSPRGTLHLRGGIVEQYYGPFFTFDANTGITQTGYARDFHYDRRGLTPPAYPTTSRFGTLSPAARTTAWKEI